MDVDDGDGDDSDEDGMRRGKKNYGKKEHPPIARDPNYEEARNSESLNGLLRTARYPRLRPAEATRFSTCIIFPDIFYDMRTVTLIGKAAPLRWLCTKDEEAFNASD